MHVIFDVISSINIGRTFIEIINFNFVRYFNQLKSFIKQFVFKQFKIISMQLFTFRRQLILKMWLYQGQLKSPSMITLNEFEGKSHMLHLISWKFIYFYPIINLIEFIHRAHRNDMENILPYLSIGLFYVMTDPSPMVAIILIRVAVVIRFVHTFVYAIYVIPQPARAICFLIHNFITQYMAIMCVIHFI